MGKPRWRIPKQPRSTREIKKPKGGLEGSKNLRTQGEMINGVPVDLNDFYSQLEKRYRETASDQEEILRSKIRGRIGRSPEGF